MKTKKLGDGAWNRPSNRNKTEDETEVEV